MKKVLMVSCEGLGNGGVQAVMMNIVCQLHTRYHFDMLLFTAERRYYDDEFEQYGHIYRIPNYEGNNGFRRRVDYYIRDNRIYRGVKAILRGHGPYDVIHCHSEFESAMCVKAAKECGVPVRIIHTHTKYTLANIIERRLDAYRLKVMIQNSTARVGCTEDACKSFYCNKALYSIIPNPYDETRFDATKYKPDDSRLVLTQVGSFNSNKNQKFTIDVFNEIHKVISDSQLNFVGFGSEDEINKLKERVGNYGLNDSVTFYPSGADTPMLLSKTTAYVFPSHHEGFGLVLIEAQAMGVKCYVSDTVPRMTDVGGCMYISLDVGATAWAERIINDYKLGRCKHQTYDCSQFSSKTVAEKIAKIYEGR